MLREVYFRVLSINGQIRSKIIINYSLFKNLDLLPQTFEAGDIVMSKDIFHKLKYANAWIFTTYIFILQPIH